MWRANLGCWIRILLLAAMAAAPHPVLGEGGVSRAHARAVAAAEAFLATLDEAGRKKAVFDFADDVQRGRWSNLPAGLYRRAGVRMGDLTPTQRQAVDALLAAILAKEGHEKVQGIVAGDEKLRASDLGGRMKFGRDEYYLAFLGRPSVTAPWGFQFGGHHLAINVTWARGKATVAPSHTGAQPAEFQINGKTTRPLGAEADLAHALVNDLEPGVRGRAILGSDFRDLVLGPGKDMRAIIPEGVSASEFTEAQRTRLLELARQWVGLLPEELAAEKMAAIQATLPDTWFAWSGPTQPGAAAYFRIHGPAVFIEYAPQRMGGIPSDHIHTIYRDPTNDYGRQWWRP